MAGKRNAVESRENSGSVVWRAATGTGWKPRVGPMQVQGWKARQESP